MKIINILFLAFIPLLIQSQEPFLNENKRWSEVRVTEQNGYPYQSSFTRFAGDTTVDQQNYMKVLVSEDSLQETWKLDALIRETETGSVFLRSFYDEKEYLLYDFGLVEGDSFKVASDLFGYFYIDSIRNEPFGIYEENRRHFYISANREYNEIIWIEGIGSLYGVLTSLYDIGVIGGYKSLLCFHENDSLKYISEEFNTCFKTGQYVSIEPDYQYTHPKVSVARGSITFKFDQNSFQKARLRLVDINGRIVFSREFVLPDRLEICTTDYLPGLYIYQIISSNASHCGKVIISH